jgi:putative copper export protein
VRALEPPELRQRLFRDLGLRFRTVGWWSIAVLIVTGIVNLAYRDLLRWEGVLGSVAFWRTPFGHALAIKMLAVAVMLTVSAVHDFVIGPAASAAMSGSPEAAALREVHHALDPIFEMGLGGS